MDYFAKKQWIRIAICAVLVAAIVLAMTGVFSGTGSLKYDPNAKKLAAGESEAEATEQGFGGEVTVHAVLEGNTVKNCPSIHRMKLKDWASGLPTRNLRSSSSARKAPSPSVKTALKPCPVLP